jgi:hypothetical protein
VAKTVGANRLREIALRVKTGRDDNSIAGDSDVERKQCAADAGPAGAFTGIRFVKRAMGPAGQKSSVVAEELVRPQSSGVPRIAPIARAGLDRYERSQRVLAA